jgi:hypothetical protein
VGKTIGGADDFYRLRVIRVDATDGVDLEWRDDILYRRPPVGDLSESESFTVEAVMLDDDEVAVPLGTFANAEAAHEWLEDLTDALAEMTKSEFEDAYFPE